LLVKEIFKISFKDLKRKSSIVILILLIIPSIYISVFVAYNLVETDVDKYYKDRGFPADIIVYNWFPYGNSTLGK